MSDVQRGLTASVGQFKVWSMNTANKVSISSSLSVIMQREEAVAWISAMKQVHNIDVRTHNMGGCSAWRNGQSLNVSARHYGQLRARLERLGYAA